MPRIHPTAVVSADACLADGVHVGAYAIIDGPVHVGAGTVVLAHAQLVGRTVIGRDCRIGPAAYVGTPAQHLHADPDAGSVSIGDGVVVRETATIQRSTNGRPTRVGDRAFVMAAAHVGHDAVVDADAVLAHGCMLGGHATVGAKAFVGGGAAVHQHCRIGRLAMVRGNEAVTHDVPPFAAALYGGLKGYNAIGCRRSGMTRAAAAAVRSAFAALHAHRVVSAAVAAIRADGLDAVPEVAELLAFVASAKRGIRPSVRQMQAHRGGDDEGGSD